MEKRLIVFFVLATLVVVGHLFLRAKFAPVKPPPVAENKEKNEPGKNNPEKGDEGQPKNNGKKSDPVPDKGGQNPEKDPEKDPAEPPPVAFSATPQWVTLGSADPATGFRMLVTLNNRGAAVERIQLNSPRYQDLEIKHGYLGDLALTDERDVRGCRVNVVGAGTPAAEATPNVAGTPNGLLAGDIIRGVTRGTDSQEIGDAADLVTVLEKTKPQEEIQLKVQRSDATLQFKVKLAKCPLEVIRPESEQYGSTGPDLLSYLLTLDSLGTGKNVTGIPLGDAEISSLPSLHDSHWEVVKSTSEEAEFRFPIEESYLKRLGLSGGLEIIRRYRLAPAPFAEVANAVHKSYHLEMDIELRRTGEPLALSYRLNGPNGLPYEGWWYSTKVHPEMFRAAGARDIVYNTQYQGHRLVGCSAIAATAKKEKKPTGELRIFTANDTVDKRTLRYIGVDTQYFGAMLLPTSDSQSFKLAQARTISIVGNIKKGWERTANISFQIASESKLVSADEPLKHTFVVFAGPKDSRLLDQYQLSSILEYGWWRWVAVGLSWPLYFFYGIFRNYGIAIIFLTVLVRSCMLPISFKMTKNSQKMQALAPEIKKIAEKYKNDMEKRSRAQQELFKKHNVNMFSGCLLVFLQLPVFAGLYRLLAVDINLRQAPLIPGWEWASNLAGPDMLWHWQAYLPGFLAEETGWLGPYFNLLPLFTIGLFLVNQKLMTPPATDEQTMMQQKVMKFMMIFMAVMFYKVPAGLCLYFIASSIWTYGEFKVLKKDKLLRPPTTPETPGVLPKKKG